MSNSLWPHGLQHTRLPCPSTTPRAYSDSCLSSWWCHPTISSSVVPFSSCPQSFSSLIFSSESALCIRRPKYWSFSFSISPSNKYSGYISFGINRFDILTVSVQFSRSVMSNSLWPHEFQDARPPCASSTPGVCSNSYPFSWWCHPTISSSAVPFSSCLQSFSASGSFQVSQFFASGG